MAGGGGGEEVGAIRRQGRRGGAGGAKGEGEGQGGGTSQAQTFALIFASFGRVVNLYVVRNKRV